MKYPKNGRFGEFGGKYIPETLVPAIEELEENYLKFKNDKKIKKEIDYYLKVYAGRPTPLYYAKNLSEKIGGAKIYLKREDLLHGGAHKINNTLGQALLAKKMQKNKIAEECLRKVVEKDMAAIPEIESAYYDFIELLVSAKRYKEALEIYGKLNKKNLKQFEDKNVWYFDVNGSDHEVFFDANNKEPYTGVHPLNLPLLRKAKTIQLREGARTKFNLEI